MPVDSIYRLSVLDAQGETTHLDRFAGKVSLVVNTACLWGKTDVSFTQLQQLQDRYESEGFSVLAFPSNDFQQELSSNQEISDFIHEHFPGTFDEAGGCAM